MRHGLTCGVHVLFAIKLMSLAFLPRQFNFSVLLHFKVSFCSVDKFSVKCTVRKSIKGNLFEEVIYIKDHEKIFSVSLDCHKYIIIDPFKCKSPVSFGQVQLILVPSN